MTLKRYRKKPVNGLTADLDHAERENGRLAAMIDRIKGGPMAEDALRGRMDIALFPHVPDPDIRATAVSKTAEVAREHTRAALQSPTATDPKEPQ